MSAKDTKYIRETAQWKWIRKTKKKKKRTEPKWQWNPSHDKRKQTDNNDITWWEKILPWANWWKANLTREKLPVPSSPRNLYKPIRLPSVTSRWNRSSLVMAVTNYVHIKVTSISIDYHWRWRKLCFHLFSIINSYYLFVTAGSGLVL